MVPMCIILSHKITHPVKEMCISLFPFKDFYLFSFSSGYFRSKGKYLVFQMLNDPCQLSSHCVCEPFFLAVWFSRTFPFLLKLSVSRPFSTDSERSLSALCVFRHLRLLILTNWWVLFLYFLFLSLKNCFSIQSGDWASFHFTGLLIVWCQVRNGGKPARHFLSASYI